MPKVNIVHGKIESKFLDKMHKGDYFMVDIDLKDGPYLVCSDETIVNMVSGDLLANDSFHLVYPVELEFNVHVKYAK
jgi:hypothetical protein